MKNYSFHIANIDCASCALKIETEMKKNKHYKDVRLNFAKLKLTFATDISSYDVLSYTQKIIQKIEPDVVLSINEKNTNRSYLFDFFRLILGILIYSFSFALEGTLHNLFVLASYFILLYKVGMKAIQLLPKFVLDENILLVISCFGAYFIDKKTEGILVITLYEIGKILENKAVNRTRKSIASLMDIAPITANIKIGGKIKSMTPYDIQIGNTVVVNLGEKVPVDGILISKKAQLDKSSLTGESKWIEVQKGEEVLSGSINMNQTIEIKATKEYKDSTISQILALVETASDKKTKAENFVEQCSKIYTPVVIVLACMIFLLLPSIFSITYTLSYYRALSFLVVACPCAIVISVPLSYFSGIGLASKNGILIKGSHYLDMARHINKIVFDKTGTITTGTFTITNIVSLNSYSKEKIYKLIYMGEQYSTHPIAKSILSYKKLNIKNEKITNIEEKAGAGISYVRENHKYKIGNNDFVQYHENSKNCIYLSEDEQVIGYIELKDTIKRDSKKAIQNLNQKGIMTYMYTGDDQKEAKKVAQKVGVKHFIYEMTPDAKYTQLEQLIHTSRKNQYVAFVGDGVNDAPGLALSDIGIAMGLKGSTLAIDSSDIVLMNDSLDKINRLITISKYTNRIILQNLIFAFAVKIVFLILSILGLTQMWMAVFADVGVTLLTILNTIKILKK